MVTQQHEISGGMQDTITRIQSLIQTKKVTKQGTPESWRYGGKELEAEMERLRTNLRLHGGYKVLGCNVFHFESGANINNPTKRLLMIPVNGAPTRDTPSGEPLLSNSYYYTEDDQLLFGEGWDIILAALAEKSTS
ncbi:uncharacterized protein BDV17DRAFT_256751 [Aspergillus undulatus]|uniref:uncharacterized protein n=1 Tax=Aspergillus undulatus TaxID=1810928 RepID=UPI003CCD0A3D